VRLAARPTTSCAASAPARRLCSNAPPLLQPGAAARGGRRRGSRGRRRGRRSEGVGAALCCDGRGEGRAAVGGSRSRCALCWEGQGVDS
jgi:hypothetical protein